MLVGRLGLDSGRPDGHLGGQLGAVLHDNAGLRDLADRLAGEYLYLLMLKLSRGRGREPGWQRRQAVEEQTVVLGAGRTEIIGGAVQPAHAPELEFVVMLPGVGAVVDLVGVGVQGTGGDFVKEGLPDMGESGIHQGNSGLALLSQFVAQASDQFKTTGAATNHDNMMKFVHSNQTCK